MRKQYYVYILATKRNGTFYTGWTKNLQKRVYEHKSEQIDGFTKKYRINNLVYYEVFDCYEASLYREKQLKKWRRESKMKLIETMNPNWKDLYKDICQ